MTKYDKLKECYEKMRKREKQYKEDCISCATKFYRGFMTYIGSDDKKVKIYPLSKGPIMKTEKFFTPHGACEFDPELACYQFGISIILPHNAVVYFPMLMKKSANNISLEFGRKKFTISKSLQRITSDVYDFIFGKIKDSIEGKQTTKTIGFKP